jgi:hypothetical protein
MTKTLSLIGAAAVAVVCQGLSAGITAAPAPQHTSAPSAPSAPATPITISTASAILTSPQAGARFVRATSIPLTVSVQQITDDVGQVSYYVDGAAIAVSKHAPSFNATWTPAVAKTYTVKAIARTRRGATFASQEVSVVVELTTSSATVPSHSTGPAPAPAPEPTPAPAPTPEPGPTPVTPLPNLPAQPLLQQSQLVYEGAFQLPSQDGQGSSFAYGGKGLAFNRERGTLLVGGSELSLKVAEVAIPEIRNSTQISDLATAQIVQPLADPTDGKFNAIATTEYSRLGGVLPYNGKIYSTIYHAYDANGTQAASHFVGGGDLSVRTDAKGPYKVGALKTGYTSGYMTEVPAAWQEALGGPAMTGNCCIAIVGRTSYGPAVFSFDPDDVGGLTNPVAGTPLLYYPGSNPLAAWEATSPYFNGTSWITGVVFPEGTRSVLFIGRHGLGAFCYGGECVDPLGSWQGPHAWPYVYRIWAYDAAEFAQVKAGLKKPWDVKPYALWNLTLPIDFPTKIIRGATYDPATQRIFVTQERSEVPLVHVFRIR